jgi:hypothetical protein
MSGLRCVVFRGLAKELEEQVNKFLESTPCLIQQVLQSESGDHLSLTILYEPDPQEDVPGGSSGGSVAGFKI